MPGPTHSIRPGSSSHVLAGDLEASRSAQHDVDLLLAVVSMVVLVVVGEARREVQHLQAEGLDPEVRAGEPHDAVDSAGASHRWR